MIKSGNQSWSGQGVCGNCIYMGQEGATAEGTCAGLGMLEEHLSCRDTVVPLQHHGPQQ